MVVSMLGNVVASVRYFDFVDGGSRCVDMVSECVAGSSFNGRGYDGCLCVGVRGGSLGNGVVEDSANGVVADRGVETGVVDRVVNAGVLERCVNGSVGTTWLDNGVVVNVPPTDGVVGGLSSSGCVFGSFTCNASGDICF